jgi:hypothetical protein
MFEVALARLSAVFPVVEWLRAEWIAISKNVVRILFPNEDPNEVDAKEHSSEREPVKQPKRRVAY